MNGRGFIIHSLIEMVVGLLSLLIANWVTKITNWWIVLSVVIVSVASWVIYKIYIFINNKIANKILSVLNCDVALSGIISEQRKMPSEIIEEELYGRICIWGCSNERGQV